MTYHVRFKVDGRFEASVEAESIEDAIRKAERRFSDADFGDLEDIDGEAIVVENENGDYLYEK